MNSSNYPDMDQNRDRSKYNYYSLGYVTIVTLGDVKIGGEFLIDCQYNTDEPNPKYNKDPIKYPTKKVAKRVAKRVAEKVTKKVAYKVAKKLLNNIYFDINTVTVCRLYYISHINFR